MALGAALISAGKVGFCLGPGDLPSRPGPVSPGEVRVVAGELADALLGEPDPPGEFGEGDPLVIVHATNHPTRLVLLLASWYSGSSQSTSDREPR
jgi:hypothetical protein